MSIYDPDPHQVHTFIGMWSCNATKAGVPCLQGRGGQLLEET